MNPHRSGCLQGTVGYRHESETRFCISRKNRLVLAGIADLDVEGDLLALVDVEANAVLSLHTLGVGVITEATGENGRAGAVTADLAAGNVHAGSLGNEGRAVGTRPATVAAVLEVELGPVTGILADGGGGNLLGSESADTLGVGGGDDNLALTRLEGENELLVGGDLEHAVEAVVGTHLVGANNLVGDVGNVGVDHAVVVLVGDTLGDGHQVGVPLAAVGVAGVASVHDLGVGDTLGVLVLAAEGDVLVGMSRVILRLGDSRRRALGGLRSDGTGRNGDRGRGGGGLDGKSEVLLSLVELDLAGLVSGAVEVGVARRHGRSAEDAGKDEKVGELHVVGLKF